MNTPAGIISVIATRARPETTMQARYSACIAFRYRVLILRLLRSLDALDQLGVLGAVFVADRLGRLEERLLVDADELHAGRLQLLLGLLGHLVPQPALLQLRLARDLAHQ